MGIYNIESMESNSGSGLDLDDQRVTYVRGRATSIDDALDKAANKSKSQIYLECSTMLDKEKRGVEIDIRTDQQIDDATIVAMRWRYNHNSEKINAKTSIGSKSYKCRGDTRRR